MSSAHVRICLYPFVHPDFDVLEIAMKPRFEEMTFENCLNTELDAGYGMAESSIDDTPPFRVAFMFRG